MMKFFLIILISTIFLLETAPATGQQGNLKIQISNLENFEGNIGLLLFAKADGFPDKNELAYKNYYFPAEKCKSLIVLNHIPFGTYAIAVIHDQNNNMEMDYNLMGIPLEGYGASNLKGLLTGFPQFNKSAFMVNHSELFLLIKMNYLL